MGLTTCGNSNGTPITDYVLYVKEGVLGTYSEAALVDPNSNLEHQLTVAGDLLVSGEQYFFQYSLLNDEGESELSDESEFALADYPVAPDAPTKVDLDSSLTSIYLEWPHVAHTEVNVIGYQLFMDAGSDGYFRMIFDGTSKPGVNYFLADNLTSGRAYNFKLQALNSNGASVEGEQVTFYSCLPPSMLLPPQYVSSTETQLIVDWTSPAQLNGCPLQSFDLYINDGAGSAVSILHDSFAPYESLATIDFAVSETSKEYQLSIVATTAGGSVTSGVASFVLANVP